MNDVKHEITPDVVQAARANPNGWVYKIEGAYGPTEYVPPEAVVGAWKVDSNGNLTGDFVENPKYQPGHSKIDTTTSPGNS
ncbi:hypothetical protein [Burkholderia sp. BCC1977]|uniref:hypothetical protein n=1 Tax=Burkholderia sp. BCC1977 TaxID=2817440 RepID=UPI002ABD78FB|nr:hypothetical protein [Burkholderia sp. BCC1977]